jgi:hypothetical protein
MFDEILSSMILSDIERGALLVSAGKIENWWQRMTELKRAWK